VNITVRQLELFVSLMRNPHIGKVAEEHFITQSAVSMAIKSLEDSVGEQLFDRISNRLVPNESGRLLLNRIRPALEQLQEVETMFRLNRMAGVLTVAASSTIADYIMPQVLFDFRCLYPEVQVEMLSRNSADVIAGIESGSVALGFIEGDYECRVAEFRELCTEELVVVSSDKDFASAREYSLEELLDMKWVLRESGSGTRQTMWEYLGPAKKRLNLFLELEHIESIKMVLKNPDTLSCMSPFCVQRELANAELFPVQVEGVEFKRRFYSVTHRQKYKSTLLQAFADHVRKHLETMWPWIMRNPQH
jgi:DNA-binding transcriptional LysR family regulator